MVISYRFKSPNTISVIMRRLRVEKNFRNGVNFYFALTLIPRSVRIEFKENELLGSVRV